MANNSTISYARTNFDSAPEGVHASWRTLRNEAWLSDVYRYARQSKLLRVDPTWQPNVAVMDLAMSFRRGQRGFLALKPKS